MTQTILSARPASCKNDLINKMIIDSMSTGRHVPFQRLQPIRRGSHCSPSPPALAPEPGESYFVTFRLADSVPQPLLRHWRHERVFGSDYIRNHGEPKEEREYEAHFSFGRIQEWLDAGLGACHICGRMCAQKSKRCLLHFDGEPL